MKIELEGMQGLGDNLYQKPIIESLLAQGHSVDLQTPWPQLYRSHSNLRLAPVDTKLWTQSRNILDNRDAFDLHRPNGKRPRISYASYQRRGLPLWQGIKQDTEAKTKVKIDGYYLELDDNGKARKPIALVRPVTYRREWPAESRSCKQEYIAYAIRRLKRKGYEVWVFAHLHSPEEEFKEFAVYGDRNFLLGELSVTDILYYAKEASIILGPVGFIVPLGIASGTPTILIHGGAGGFNRPEIINAPGKGELIHVLPRRYCLCQDHQHDCDKNIETTDIDYAIDQANQLAV